MTISPDPVRLLLDFDQAVSWPDISRVTQETLSFVETRFDFDRVSITLLDSNIDYLDVYTLDTSVSELSNGQRLIVETAFQKHILTQEKPRYIPQLSQKKTHNPVEKLLLAAGYQSSFIIPLRVGKDVVGSLNVDSRQPEGFPLEKQNLLVLLSSRLALALFHARLHDDLAQREQELMLSERNYRELVDQAGDVILKFTAEGRLIQANGAATRMIGYSNQELLSMDVSQLFDAEVLKLKPLRFDLLKAGLTVLAERELKHKDGSTLPVEMNTKSLSGGFLVSIIRDLTDRNKTNQQLLDQKNQISALFDTIPAPLYAKDKKGRYIMLNDAYLNFFGKTKDEMLGKTVTQVWSTKSAVQIELDDQLLIENNERQDYHHEVKNTAGDVRQVQFRKARYLDASGNVAGFVGTILDYTDLQAAEDRYQTLFTNSPDPIVVHDGKVVLTANQAALEFFKTDSLEKYIQKPLSLFLHKSSQKKSKQRIKELLSTHQANALTQQQFIISTGEIRDVEVMAVPIVSEGRELIMASFRDVTDQKQAQELLRSSEENFRNLIEATPSPIIVHVNHSLVYANQSALDFSGAKSLDKYLGLDTRTLVHPDFKKQSLDTAVKLIKTGDSQPLSRLKFFRLNGEARDVESMSSPVVFEGKPAIMVFFRDITDELKIQLDLSNSESRYRRAFDYSPTAMVLHDRGILVDANQAALNFAQVESLNEVVGKNLFSFIHKDFLELAESRMMTALEKDQPTALLEQKFLTAAGEERWVEALGYPVHQGEKSLLMVSFNDIHDRVMARQQIEASRRQLEMVTGHVTNFIILIDLNLSILYVNQATANWLEKSSDNLSGVPLSDLVPQSELEKAQKFIPQLMNGEVCSYLHPYSSAVKGNRFFWTTLIPVLDDSGGVLAFLVQMEDITERETTRKELADNKALLELIIDTIPGLFSYTDTDERYLFVNEAYARWHGQEKTDIIGKNIKEILSPRGYQEVQKNLAEIVSGQEQVFSRWSKGLDGQNYAFDVRYIPHFDSNKKTKAFLTSIQDVTVQRNAERRQRALQELAYSLTKAMDMRNIGAVSAQTLRTVFESDAITIELYDLEKSLILGIYSEDTFAGDSEPQSVTVNDLPISSTTRYDDNFRAECINRTEAEMKRQKDTVSFGDSRPSCSLLFVPLRREGVAVGVVSVQSYTPEKYDETDLPLLQSFADQIGGALVRAKSDARLLEKQQALEKEEEKYRSIIENAGDAVFVCNTQGQIHTVNENACLLSGFTENELTQKNLKALDPTFFKRMNRKALIALQENGESLTFQSQYIQKDQGLLPVELRVGITEIEKKPHILIFARDVTDRKQAELREKTLRTLAHDLNESTTMHSVGKMAAKSIRSFFESDAFTIEFFDSESKIIIGVYTEDTFTGDKVPRVLVPIDTAFSAVRPDFFTLNAIAHVRNRSKEELKQIEGRRAFGSSRLSHSLLFAPIVWEGENVGVLTVQSYTDHKYSEDDLPNIQTFADQIGGALLRARKDEELTAKKNELQESEEKYRSMIENAGDALFVTSLKGEILAFNQHATSTLGYSEEELLGLPFKSINPDFSKQIPLQKLTELINTQASITLETTHVRKDGSNIPVELRLGSMELQGQKCLLCFARDVSDRKEAEDFRDAMRRMARQLTVSLEPRQVGIIAAAVLYDLFNYDAFALYKLDFDQNTAIGLYAQDTFNDADSPVEVETGSNTLDVLNQKSVFVLSEAELINRPHNTSSIKMARFGNTSRKSKSLVFVPIFWEGSQIGLFSLQSYTSNKFTDNDLAKLKVFANQIGGAIVRAQTDEALLDQSNQLQATLGEKEVLLKEVYHRTKNNMQVIVGLLEMHGRKTSNGQTREVLKEMTNRIYSMSMVHDLLYRSKNLAEIRLDSYLEKLIERLIAAYNTSLGEISLKFSSEAIPINIQLAIPLGLVINEVVSNALKYAFPDNRDGQITLSAKRIGAVGLELQIRDNGVGPTKGVDLNDSNTLGTRIIKDIVQLQLQGDLKISLSPGVNYHISIRNLSLD